MSDKKNMAKQETKGGLLSKIFKNHFVTAFLAMAAIACVLVVLVLFGLKQYTKHGEIVVVPSVVGLQVEEAAGILNKASLQYEVVDSVFLTNGIPGAITDQIPEEKSNVKKNRVIFLTMQAKSVEMVTIPGLIDFSQRQAVATLNSLGFMNISSTNVPSAYRGLVIDITHKGKTIEANSKIPKGDPITLIVGAGGEVLIDSLIDIIPDIDPTLVQPQREEEDPVDNSFFE